MRRKCTEGKQGDSEENEMRYHLLNEHFYEPGIMLRTFHSHENFMRWVLSLLFSR